MVAIDPRHGRSSCLGSLVQSWHQLSGRLFDSHGGVLDQNSMTAEGLKSPILEGSPQSSFILAHAAVNGVWWIMGEKSQSMLYDPISTIVSLGMEKYPHPMTDAATAEEQIAHNLPIVLQYVPRTSGTEGPINRRPLPPSFTQALGLLHQAGGDLGV
jgi:hypothetical protein